MLTIRQQLVYYDGKHHKAAHKSGTSERRIPIGPEHAQVLHDRLAKLDEVAKRNPCWEATDLMFPNFHGRPIEPRNLYRARNQSLKTLGLPHVTPHELSSLYANHITR